MRVFGIDCGTEFTGWGVVELGDSARARPAVRGGGDDPAGKKDRTAERLLQIHTELSGLIAVHEPDVVAIEEVFFSANAKSALKLGQVRGVAMLAAAGAGREVAEYAPLVDQERGGGVRAGGKGAGAVYGDAVAGFGGRARLGRRGGCAGDSNLPPAYGGDDGAVCRRGSLRIGIGMAVWLAGLASFASAQDGRATLEFHMVRAGAGVPEYTFVVAEADGRGTYTAKTIPPAPTNRYAVVSLAAPTESVQAVMLNEAGTRQVFALARAAKGLKDCQSRRKGIADTGAKTLTLREGGEVLTCSYNFSENKAVAELTDLLQSMSFTLDEARKMEREQRYDRLALDGEMTLLVTAAKEGRAAGLANIRPVLQALVDDQAVLERVRMQASKLLEQSTMTP